jgi:hypothetical protein
MPDEFEVIGSTCRRADELLEGELRGLATSPGHLDFAAPHNLDVCVRGVIDRITQVIEPFLRVALSNLAQRMVVNGRRGTGDFPVICRGVEIDHAQIGFKKIDAWNEGFALNAIFVQVVRVTVGGSDEDDAVGHKNLEQADWKDVSRNAEGLKNGSGEEHIPSQDHCIGYIRALELVKAKHAGELGDVCRNHR